MKNKIIALLAVAACFWMLYESRGQEAPAPTPAPAHPKVKLPRTGTWTIQFTIRSDATPTPSPSPGQPPPPPPKTKTLASIDVATTPTTRREIAHFSDGSSTELWRISEAWYCMADGHQVIGLQSFGGSFIPYWKSFTAAGLQRIVSSGTGVFTTFYSQPAMLYTGVQKESGQNDATSLAAVLKAGPNSAPVYTTPEGLFLNPQTSYPIAYYNPFGIYAFTNIIEGLSGALVPPPEFAEMAQRASAVHYVARPPPRP